MHVSHVDDVQSKSDLSNVVSLLDRLEILDVANNPWLTNRQKEGRHMLFYQSIALVRLGITLIKQR